MKGGFTVVESGNKKKQNKKAAAAQAENRQRSSFKATREEIEARVGVTSFAMEHLAMYNELRIADGEQPCESLVEVAVDLRDAGDLELANYYFQLNNQNNQAKHDFTRNFK